MQTCLRMKTVSAGVSRTQVKPRASIKAVASKLAQGAGVGIASLALTLAAHGRCGVAGH